MWLTLIRRRDTHDATTGELMVDGVLFCVTLEDTFHKLDEKVYGETRISAGSYPIELRKAGSKYPVYLDKYGTNGMLWLRYVDGFKWVYIHIGNFASGSLGCILVAESTVLSIRKGKIKQNIKSSTPVYKKLHKLVAGALNAGEKVWITIIDN